MIRALLPIHPRIRRPAILVAAAICACTQLPSRSVPGGEAPDLVLPARWSTALPDGAAPAAPDRVAALARWWQQLGDPLLDELIDAALAGSPDLRLARARLRQARAGRDQAASGLWPSLSASAGASRNLDAAAPGGQSGPTLYDAGFDARWEVDVFGATRQGIEAADADRAASEASLRSTRVSLVSEVALNYVEVRSYQRRTTIAQDNLKSQAETLEITDWRYQAGLATSIEVEQARTSLEQTRASIPDLTVAQAAAENRLAVLLGRSPGALRERLAPARTLPELPAAIATGIPADVLRQRPDLVAAERTLAAETARTGQRQAKRFPSLNLGASFGWQAYGFAALGGTATLARAVSGALAATLFDGGRLRSDVEIQSAIQEQALIAYQASVLAALEEIENALASYAAGRERVEARRAAAAAARNAALLSRDLYQSGLTDFQTVLNTDRTRLSTEDALATAEAGMRTSLIRLYKALGGGWDRTAAMPTGGGPAGPAR